MFISYICHVHCKGQHLEWGIKQWGDTGLYFSFWYHTCHYWHQILFLCNTSKQLVCHHLQNTDLAWFSPSCPFYTRSCAHHASDHALIMLLSDARATLQSIVLSTASLWNFQVLFFFTFGGIYSGPITLCQKFVQIWVEKLSSEWIWEEVTSL